MISRVEKRHAVRYREFVPVVVAWQDLLGITRKDRGFTRDISSQGIFVHSDIPIDAGMRASVLIEFPPLGDSQRGPRLLGEGQVVRVEGGIHRVGFAVRADSGLREATPHDRA